MISLRLFSFFISVTLLSSMFAMEEGANSCKCSLDLVEQSQPKRIKRTISHGDLADVNSSRIASLRLLCAQELRKHITCQELIKAMNEIPGSDVVIKALVEAHPVFDLLSQYTPYKKKFSLENVGIQGVRKEVEWSPNLKFCGVGTKIWNVEKGTVKKEFNKDFSLGAWSFDSKYIGVVIPDGRSRTLEVWDIEAGVKKRSFSAFIFAYWSKDCNRLRVQFSDYSYMIWNVEEDSLVRLSFVKENNCLGFSSPDFKYFLVRNRMQSLSLGFGGKVAVWDIDQNALKREFDHCDENCSFFFPNSKYFLIKLLANGGIYEVWDIEKNVIKKRFGEGVRSVQSSPNSRYVAVFDNKNTIKICDIEKDEIKKETQYISDMGYYLARWSPDSRYVALFLLDEAPLYGIKSGQLEIWDVEQGIMKKKLEKVAIYCTALGEVCTKWSQDSRHIAVKFSDHTVEVLDVESDVVRCKFDNVEGFNISPDFERVRLSFKENDTVEVWSIGDNKSQIDQLRSSIKHSKQIDALKEIRSILAGMGSEGQKKQLLLDLKKGDTEKDLIVDKVLAMMP